MKEDKIYNMHSLKQLVRFFKYQHRKDKTLFNVNQFEKAAGSYLPKNIFDFFAGGAGEELSLRENIAAFDRLKLIPRILKGINTPSLSTKILEQDVPLPILIAPMAFQKLVHRQGETAVARASSQHGVLMTVSTLSTSHLKDIKQVSSIPPWLQLYIYKDREITKSLIKAACDLGYKAIVLTVDTPLYAKKLREPQNPISLNSSLQVVNLVEAGLKLDNINSSCLPQYLSSLLAPNICWKDIEWLRSISSLPILLKGILHPDDVRIAISHNIEGIILSNHGGRQLDTAITALEALQVLRDDVKEKTEIIIDGGVRKGVDILKALALGAKGVMIGRPIIWGLAVNGEEGVSKVIHILKEELSLAMSLSGCSSIDQINKDIIFR